MSDSNIVNNICKNLMFWITSVPFFVVILAAVAVPCLPVLPLPQPLAKFFSVKLYAAAFLGINMVLVPALFAACRYFDRENTQQIFFRAMYIAYIYYCFLVGFMLGFGIGVALFSLVTVMFYVGITIAAVVVSFLSMTIWSFCCKICDGDFVSRAGRFILMGIISGVVLLVVTYKYL